MSGREHGEKGVMVKKNCGEQSMFLVENAHEPIVSKEIFEDAQRRKHKM